MGVVAIAAGGEFSLALRSDGTVAGWGHNDRGQTTIPNGLSNVVAIAAGNEFSLALKSDGTVIGWGNDSFGRLTPPAGLSGIVAIAAGYYHSLAIGPPPAPVEVTFSVDLTHTPLASGEIAGLRGGTAPLGWESTTFLSDDDGDDVWTGTVAFDASTAGQTLEYKFVRHDANENPPAATLGAAGGFEGDVGRDVNGDTFANRLLMLPAEDTVLPVVFWNNYTACSTDAPVAVGSFSLTAGEESVTLANTSAVNEVDLAGCTLAVFDPYDEVVLTATTSDERLAAGLSTEWSAGLTAGPGAFALVAKEVGAGARVVDVLGTVVAAVVYAENGSVYGQCGNGAGVRACNSAEGRAEMAAAFAALYGGATAAEDDRALDLAVAVAPNPSAGRTRVTFGLAAAGDARVTLHDALGREVAVLADGPFGTGRHPVDLDAASLPTGVYAVRVVAGGGVRSALVTVVR